MKKNIGIVDFAVRLSIGVFLAYIGFFNGTIITSRVPRLIVGVFALVPLLTALARFFPLYTLVGINTCNSRKTAG